ncbi:MAG: GNAT family N-acetyltransferase [Nitrospirae bacterium]|nr:GNAT family N-acetyltransferase [Nitrospirota bacterium]
MCTNCIFQEPWWLDAVAPGSWGAVEARRGEEVAARLPYVIRKRYGLTFLNMPPLTQTLGPWIRSSTAKIARRYAEQKDLMTELIEKLPPYDCFNQNFQYSVTNWLPFYWRGFDQTTRYTYIIDDLSDTERIWKGFQENIRRDIRKAQKVVAVRCDLGIDRFLEVNALTFQRQGMKQPHSRDLYLRLDAACDSRNARRIFFAEDVKGCLHAALYMVWDQNSAYYLMGGGAPELRNSGATSLLMWEAIKHAASVTRKFDFEGSMIESVERFFRAFGALQVPYFNVTRMSRKMKVLSASRDLLNACR